MGTTDQDLAAFGSFLDAATGIGFKSAYMAVGVLASTRKLKKISTVASNSGPLNFTQTTASKFFSKEGDFAGHTIGEVSQMLRSGKKLNPADVPVEFIVKDGNRLIVNTRSSLALKRAGIPESQWNLINKTGNAGVDSNITNRLIKNELTTSGTDTLRITGSGIPRSSSLD